MAFTVIRKEGNARRGRFETAHGTVETPVFMNVATQGAIKGGLNSEDLERLDCRVALCNTYHLHLRPGEEIVRSLGGLHGFMDWHRPILTDSGGFQIFSLASLRKITEEGVSFRSHIDGAKIFMSPEDSIRIQSGLGSDIAMAFDECAPAGCSYDYTVAAMERTHRWAERCKDSHTRADQALFGIIQGGMFGDLRIESTKALTGMDFPGYGIGGLSVGEPKPVMYEMLDTIRPYLPENKPHYLMGVGSPDCLVEGSMRGIDMFDCVMQTRTARNALAMTFDGKKSLKQIGYREDFTPIEEGCDCYACRHFTKAYIRHLIKADEILAAQLITIHNLRFTYRLMAGIRQAIREDRLMDYRNELMLRGTFN